MYASVNQYKKMVVVVDKFHNQNFPLSADFVDSWRCIFSSFHKEEQTFGLALGGVDDLIDCRGS